MPSNMENVCRLSDFSKKFQIYFDISRKSCIFAQNLKQHYGFTTIYPSKSIIFPS